MELKLQFDKELIGLGGQEFGTYIWETQIKQYQDQPHITLIFPDQIELVTTSFGRGLLNSEINKLGINAVKRKYTIQSTRKGFEKQFWNCWD